VVACRTVGRRELAPRRGSGLQSRIRPRPAPEAVRDRLQWSLATPTGAHRYPTPSAHPAGPRSRPFPLPAPRRVREAAPEESAAAQAVPPSAAGPWQCGRELCGASAPRGCQTGARPGEAVLLQRLASPVSVAVEALGENPRGEAPGASSPWSRRRRQSRLPAADRRVRPPPRGPLPLKSLERGSCLPRKAHLTEKTERTGLQSPPLAPRGDSPGRCDDSACSAPSHP